MKDMLRVAMVGFMALQVTSLAWGDHNHVGISSRFPAIEADFLHWYQVHSNASANSVEERIAEKRCRDLIGTAVATLTEEFKSGAFRHREIEELFLQLDRKYKEARANSLKEEFYETTAKCASQAAVQQFELDLRRFYSPGDPALLTLLGQYKERYNAASANSPPESYYREVMKALEHFLTGS